MFSWQAGACKAWKTQFIFLHQLTWNTFVEELQLVNFYSEWANETVYWNNVTMSACKSNILYYNTVQTVQKGAIEHQPGLVTVPKISIFKHMCDQ